MTETSVPAVYPTSSAVQKSLHELVNSTSISTWSMDVNDVCVYLNPRDSTSSNGLEGISLLDWAQFIHPDDFQQTAPIYQKAKADRTSFHIEYRIIRSDGTVRWMMTTGAPRFSDRGKFRGYTGTTVDVTERHETQARITKREARFRLLSQYASEVVCHCAPDGVILDALPSTKPVLGYDVAEFVGRNLYDLVHPDDADAVRKEIHFLIPSKNVSDTVECQLLTREGVYLWFRAGIRVFLDTVTKEHIGTVLVMRDITKTMELTAKSAALAAENEALVDNSLDMMTLVDGDGRLLRVNRAAKRIVGYEPHELLGRLFMEFVAPQDRDQTRIFVTRLSGGNINFKDFENRWVRKDGSVVHLSWSVSWSDSSNLMYATARDISERYYAQEVLQQSYNRFTTMLESMGNAFFSMDRNWRVTYANRKTIDLVKLTQDELIGKILWEAVPEALDLSIVPYYEHAMTTGESVHFEAYYAPAFAWVEVHAYPNEDGLSVFIKDVSEQHNAQNTIRKGEQRLREVVEMTPAGYILADAQSRMIDVNPALCGIAGYAREELVGQSLIQLFTACPCDGELSVQNGATEFHSRQCSIRHKEGYFVYVLLNSQITRDEQGNALSLTAFVTDITERIEAEAEFEQLAMHDALTGLPNRNLLNQRLQAVLESAPREETNAVMFIDLDRFKEVNDSMGHKAGDILLRKVAKRMKQSMRPGDIVARLGGDEFVIVAHCARGADSAAGIAEKILSSLAAPIEIEGQEVFVSGSIGISLFPQDGQTKEELFQKADTAMYHAKAVGRNGFQFCTEEMSAVARRRVAMGNALRRALERNEFTLHFQPRIDLVTMEISGMEALLRWTHPNLGSVAPAEFIPLAEETGLIQSIEPWVLEEACRQTLPLINRVGRPLHLSVNLSARRLKLPNLSEQVAATLSQTGFPPHLLELELTETAFIDDMELCTVRLRKLKDLGIRLSVDDFGTGHSGLAYLKHFPMDIIKLDRSFVEDGTHSLEASRFLKAAIDLAHTLNMTVVAEGVETHETLRFLLRTNCDEAQGFLFAQPMPVKELEERLTKK